MRLFGYFRRKYNEDQAEKHKLLGLVAAAGASGLPLHDVYSRANGADSQKPIAPLYNHLLEMAKEGVLEHFHVPDAPRGENRRFRITPAGEMALRQGPKQMPAPKLGSMNFRFSGAQA